MENAAEAMEHPLHFKLQQLGWVQEKSNRLLVDMPGKTPISDDELHALKRRTIDDFFQKEPFAKAVSLGEESYIELVSPIHEHYSTAWKRFWRSKDSEFDQYVQETVLSLLKVNAPRESKIKIVTDFIKTGGESTKCNRRTNIILSSALGVMGLCGGAMMDPHTASGAAKYAIPAAIVTAAITYAIGKKLHKELLDLQLGLLSEQAAANNTYLQELHKEFYA